MTGLVLSVVVGAIIVVAGYFAAGILLSGIGAAVGELPLNILQVVGGGVLGAALFALVRQAYPPITRFGSPRD
jgi:uncharacterized membrane protein